MVEFSINQSRDEKLPLLGSEKTYSFLHVQVSSSKQDSIDRKCARPEHRSGCADGCQHDRNPRITGVGECYPYFDDSDQYSHERRPEPDQKKHGGACTDDVRNHRYGKR